MLAFTGRLLESKIPINDFVRRLRDEGFSLSESIGVLIKVACLSPTEARVAVVESPAWKDLRDQPETYREIREWVDPVGQIENKTLERLDRACRNEPQLREVWLTWCRLTRADRSESSRDVVGFELVFDPEAADANKRNDNWELATRVAAAAEAFDISQWCFTNQSTPNARKHGLKAYPRDGLSGPVTEFALKVSSGTFGQSSGDSPGETIPYS
jgi:hypothetical protein